MYKSAIKMLLRRLALMILQPTRTALHACTISLLLIFFFAPPHPPPPPPTQTAWVVVIGGLQR